MFFRVSTVPMRSAPRIAPRPCDAINIDSRDSGVPVPVSTSAANAGSIVRIGMARNVLTATRIVKVSMSRLSRT